MSARPKKFSLDPAPRDEGGSSRVRGLGTGWISSARSKRTSGRTTSTSAAVMVVRPSSSIWFTAWMQNFWMPYGLRTLYSKIASTASGAQRKTPSTGWRMSASASSRVKAVSSISSKKLYQGLPSLFQMRLIPTPLMMATRCSENVFMKMLRRRWFTRSEYSLRTSTSSMRRASLTFFGVRVARSSTTRWRSWLKSRPS